MLSLFVSPESGPGRAAPPFNNGSVTVTLLNEEFPVLVTVNV